MPGVIGAVLIIFIPCIGDYITPKLVGGPEGLMIANMIQVQFSKANNAPLAAALSVTSLLIVGIISLLFVFLNRKYLGEIISMKKSNKIFKVIVIFFLYFYMHLHFCFQFFLLIIAKLFPFHFLGFQRFGLKSFFMKIPYITLYSIHY